MSNFIGEKIPKTSFLIERVPILPMSLDSIPDWIIFKPLFQEMKSYIQALEERIKALEDKEIKENTDMDNWIDNRTKEVDKLFVEPKAFNMMSLNLGPLF